MTPTACLHRRTAIYRQPFRRGVNVCGPAVWVSRAEVIARGLDPDSLPLAASIRQAQQPLLFGDKEGL
jgi:hypothetical protein